MLVSKYHPLRKEAEWLGEKANSRARAQKVQDMLLVPESKKVLSERNEYAKNTQKPD